MKQLKNKKLKEHTKKLVTPSEQIRTLILKFGYDVVEWRSKIKRYFRESYVLAEGIENYTNIPLSTADRPRGKRSF